MLEIKNLVETMGWIDTPKVDKDIIEDAKFLMHSFQMMVCYKLLRNTFTKNLDRITTATQNTVEHLVLNQK